MNKFIHFFIFISLCLGWIVVALRQFYQLMTFICLQFEGGMSHLSLLDPSMRAIPLSPSEWRDRLEAINKTDLTGKDNPNRNYILLDVRNGIGSIVPE